MSWTITPSGGHPEAVDWQARVLANGGTVSRSTMNAVSSFCTAIDAESGLRTAITRLNLFCGDQLAAALVPLYLAESFAATPKGNAIDTNNNFVDGNYTQTGTSGGLRKASNTNAYLNTGLSPSLFGALTSQHLSVSAVNCATTNATDAVFLGSYNGDAAPNSTLVSLDEVAAYLAGANDRAFRQGTTNASNITGVSLQASEPHFLGTRTSATLSTVYRNGTSVATNNANTSPLANTLPIFVFALNLQGTPTTYSSANIRMYSIGSGVTASQASALSAAVSAFNTALSR